MEEKQFDIIVIGGGIAGCSAALAARREGCRVLLLEKLTVLGGLATTGHIVIYLPLDDGYGRQVIGGISEELLKLSARYAYFGDDYTRWRENGKRYAPKSSKLSLMYCSSSTTSFGERRRNLWPLSVCGMTQ